MSEYRSVPLPIGEGEVQSKIAQIISARSIFLKGQQSFYPFQEDSECCWIETGCLMEADNYQLGDPDLGFLPKEVPYINTYVNSVFNLCGGNHTLAAAIICEQPEVIDKIIAFVNGDDTHKDEFVPYPRGNNNGS